MGKGDKEGTVFKISNEFTFTSPLYNASRNYVYINNDKVTKYIFNLNENN